MVVLIVFCFIISLPNVEIIHKTFCAICALDVVISRRNKLTSDRKKQQKATTMSKLSRDDKSFV